ncbi:M15 family metallopeptidase [Nocardioides currus]|uniref:Peptidase M15 n=1 Tax=Nocardioides currus TaxID=2133958 RepID=A0A2R7Z1X1_9ACTN|nr:M15 family metallopeptidase [Nocardioides currus]PUA82611.1 peptidase M15 [Nocardioides currus]
MTTISRILTGVVAIAAAVVGVAASPTLDGVRHDDATTRVGTTGLDPGLRAAIRRATDAAAADGVTVRITSGWRSPAHQRRLLAAAVEEYGSEEEAARWVATPETSPHVQGEAVDIGPYDAMDWMSRHGSAFGLCQIYANEPWHYEVRPRAVEDGCPAAYDDPTQDPRMR